MQKSDIEVLSEYYQSELSFLRSSGVEFAKRFPRIAQKLDFTSNESADPHLERLIESCAFLTGKLQKQIDDLSPDIAYALLSVICQPLTAPVPSFALAVFDVDFQTLAGFNNLKIPKGTILHTHGIDSDIPCKFSTCSDLELYPIKILDHAIVNRDLIKTNVDKNSQCYLKIHMRSWGKLEPGNRLKFYLDSYDQGIFNFFDFISMAEGNVLFQVGDDGDVSLGQPAHGLGFDKGDDLFPYQNHIPSGFRIAYEYFAFPGKFLGISVDVAKEIPVGEFSVYIPILVHTDNQNSFWKNIKIHNNTVTMANLFPKITEPLDFNNKSTDYVLCPDWSRHKFQEIYAINKMISVSSDGQEVEIPPYYSSMYKTEKNDNGLFWIANRKNTRFEDSRGDDVWISFVDLKFDPKLFESKTVYAHTICTNRYFAEQIPARGILQVEAALPVKGIYVLNKPTPQRPRCTSGEGLWRLISLLSLNNTGLYSTEYSNVADYVKETLRVFSDTIDPVSANEIESIKKVTLSSKTSRLGDQAWRGFINGIHATFEMDGDNENICSKTTLSKVVQYLISSYLSINNFVSLDLFDSSVKNRILKSWPAITGTQQII